MFAVSLTSIKASSEPLISNAGFFLVSADLEVNKRGFVTLIDILPDKKVVFIHTGR